MNEKPRILYIGNKLSKKGITVTSIETLGAFLEQEGYRVYKASSFHNKLLRLFDMLFAVVKYSSKVSVVLIDTYSTQNFYFAVSVANLCRLLRLPYIPILRGGDLPKRLEKSNRMSRKLFHGAKINVAPSMFLLEAFKNRGYSNLRYVPNTIEIEKYRFVLRKKISPKILWVRSFAEIYNPMLAIEVLEKLNLKGYNATMCMVGPDKDGTLKKCKDRAIEKGLDVVFTGKLEKQEWIQLSEAFDIFINTTNFDNTPVSVIEAMAVGLPIVSTNVGGVPFLIDDRVDGILVPPNDSDSFVKSIEDLIGNEDLTSSLSENGRKKVVNFDWQKVKHTWNALLND